MPGSKIIRMINLRALSFFKVQKLENSAEFAIFKGVPASLLSFGCFWKLLLLLLLLLLEDGCLLHASTPCSRSLHLRQQQLCPHASLLEKLEPAYKAEHGPAQSLNGAGKVQYKIAGQRAGACKLAQGNVSLRSSQGGTTSASQSATRS